MPPHEGMYTHLVVSCWRQSSRWRQGSRRAWPWFCSAVSWSVGEGSWPGHSWPRPDPWPGSPEPGGLLSPFGRVQGRRRRSSLGCHTLRSGPAPCQGHWHRTGVPVKVNVKFVNIVKVTDIKHVLLERWVSKHSTSLVTCQGHSC